MNPCRCGFLGDAARECKKAPICGEDYKNKISGPFLDRIDIIINVGAVDIFSQKKLQNGERSEVVKARVIKAREIQKKRQKQQTNSEIDGEILEKFCALNEEGQKILQNFVQKSHSSMRGITRILRVARSIADLEDAELINTHHLLEAISYRRKI
jgi:magnesium chelatase family protein